MAFRFHQAVSLLSNTPSLALSISKPLLLTAGLRSGAGIAQPGSADRNGVVGLDISAESTKSPFASALDVIFVAIVCSIVVIKIWESSNLYIPIMVTSLIYALAALVARKPRSRAIKFALMDASLFLLVLVEAISYVKSTYQPNSLGGLEDVLFLFLFYSLVRFGLQRDFQRTAILVFLSLLGFWISSRALYSFCLHYRRLSGLGFTDLTAFKHLFGMVGSDGYSTGERITTLLLFLPFPVILLVRFRERPIVRWLLLCPVITIIAALSITFSRAVYLSIAAFLVTADLTLWQCRLFPAKAILRFNSVGLLVLVLALVPIWKSVLTTAAIASTESQVRSIEGRADTWRNSMEIARRHLLYGVGARNFPMQYVFYSEARPSFVPSSYNYFLQVLLEKGALGLAAYVLMLIAFFWISYKKVKRRELSDFHTAIIALSVAACIAVLVRDLTFSSLLINKGASVLLWFGFANVVNSES
jgi:O-antigen ligase